MDKQTISDMIYIKLNEATKEEFEKSIKSKKLILFGASSCAKKFLSEYEVLCKPELIIDNDEKKWNRLFEEKYIVKGIDALKQYNRSEIVILITSTYAMEIGEQLMNHGYNNYYSYLHILNLDYSNFKVDKVNIKNIMALKELLADEDSRTIVDILVERRNHYINDYKDICLDNQYFIDEIFIKSDQEVYIDAGTFDGATLLAFQEWVNNQYKRIYAFEMDKKNYLKLKDVCNQHDLIIYNAGVWNKNETVYYTPGESSSRITSAGKEKIECIALDSLIKEKVTFIKMDIEGAELKALEGCKNIIAHDKPKLAICLYHKPEHLWEIPFYIHQLVPQYKFYIRHHSKDFCETVLYATL